MTAGKLHLGMTVPVPICADRKQWFEASLARRLNPAAPEPDHTLLITGLRRSDSLRWKNGIEDAVLERDPTDGSPFVVLHFRRPDGSVGTTFRCLDLEAAFVLQAHVLLEKCRGG